MKFLCSFLALVILTSSCKKQDATIPCNPNISYSQEVKGIFVRNCTLSGCHDGVNMPSLAEYSTAHDAAAQIRSSVGKGRMPLNSTISEKNKAAILCWIDSGSKFN